MKLESVYYIYLGNEPIIYIKIIQSLISFKI